MSESKETSKHIGTSYEHHEDGTLYSREWYENSDGKKYGVDGEIIANHTPLLKELCTIDDGFEQTERLIFNVLQNYKLSIDKAVTLKDILGNQPNLCFNLASCRIERSRGAKAKYSESLQMQCENAPHKTIYNHTGYTMVDGERIFLNGEYSVNKDGLTDKHIVELSNQLSRFKFTPDKDPDRYKSLLDLLSDSYPVNKSLMYAGVGYSFLTALNGLLREISLEPRFILYIVAKTGIGKTSAAMFFLNFFGDFNYNTPAPSNFNSTINSNEKLYALTDSTLMLLDDRIPSTTPQIKQKMENMEQAIARGIGDKAGKSRMNADGSLRTTYQARCNLIVTAEEAYNNVGESGTARSIAVDLKQNDIQMNGTGGFKEKYMNRQHLNQCMSEFIQYVICNWDIISEKATNINCTLTQKGAINGHGRLTESIIALQTGITIMCDWLISINELSIDEAKNIINTAWEIYTELATEQERKLTADRPTSLFLNAINSMLESNDIQIKDVERVGDTNNPPIQYGNNSIVGVKFKDMYYLLPDKTYNAVINFYSKQGITFPLNQNTIVNHLRDGGYIKVGSRNYIQKHWASVDNDKNKRYLALFPHALEIKNETEDN